MLPLSLLKTAVSQPMMVELKNGETYNGVLLSCDHWMNLHLKDVILTSKDGDRFWKIEECYVRGNTIKYMRVPDDSRGGVSRAAAGAAADGEADGEAGAAADAAADGEEEVVDAESMDDEPLGAL
ncbi:hypothetical protein PPROV_000242600 [Pycnococcus provasolii]|uniref:U6 snRNA-associated Sm-like protein LSm4 n=1 Tax=Pycnococcus provasolii TaxID=41880 RepID=A0A830HDL6_9CHLO|nr:hypothetical protein PPROV_000242600 [Pycnococcus provasolii]